MTRILDTYYRYFYISYLHIQTRKRKLYGTCTYVNTDYLNKLLNQYKFYERKTNAIAIFQP